MIWVTLRQFRVPALVAAVGLVVVAVVAVVTGPHLVHLYDTSGIATCRAHGDCPALTAAFLTHDGVLAGWLNSIVLVVPALVGIFWGAPLVARELETGTFRAAWTQSVTRTRWLAVKLGLVGLASMVVAGLCSLMVTWWSSPIDQVTMNRFTDALFGERAIAPVGYAAFAFALGVAAGMLLRRTLPAMATTLAVFVVARAASALALRPHLITPLRATVPFQANLGNGPPASGPVGIGSGDWIYSQQTINAAGKTIGQNGGVGPNGNIGLNVAPDGTLTFNGVGRCPNKVPAPTLGLGGHPILSNPQGALQTCATKLRIREVVTYQPLGRYWEFQWYEAAIFFAAALVLAGFCLWWVRHRLR
jgi:ABC-2 family transporter protein